tara:strand:+ start:36 stop:1274 length:1239 start_codon:yes stop_codon:yes gene_type:complete
MPKDLIIVGGGITGIASALYAAEKRKFNVHLIEKSSYLGGVLRDFSDDKGKNYFKDAQYISANSPLLNLVDYGQLISFEDSYGSYTCFQEKDIAIKDFPGPVFDKSHKPQIYNNTEKEIKTCADYLKLFPKKINDSLLKYTNKFCDPYKTHFSCLKGLHLERITIEKSFNKIKELKEKNIYGDKLYGLPRNYRGINFGKYFLPKSKYNNFFYYIQNLFKEKEIKLSLNSTVKVLNSSDLKRKISIDINNKILDLQEAILIWTSDPNPLLNLFNIKSKSKPIRMKNMYYERKDSVKSPFYINIFSSDLPITRIYLYENLVTVEALHNNSDEKFLINNIKKIMFKFLPEQCFSPKNDTTYRFNENRYILFTQEEEEKMRQIYKSFPESNIVFTPWLSYSRDEKIESIFDSIDSL